jgi:cellulose synthase/poly-beta-1,6-N-acetylglucosamine synthase-like glycosyltransferase
MTLLAVIIAALVYTWIGYPVALWILTRALRRRQVRQERVRLELVQQELPRQAKDRPSFSIIVACYNEEARIAIKLADCLALQYPREKLEIIVASDGSIDATERIVEEFAERDPRIRLLRSEDRAGKSGVQNLAAAQARGEILLFTDAETRTRPGLLGQIAEDFADPTVGMVAPIVRFGRFDDSISQGQGSYWRFELFLRQLESDLGILATASGAALAVRRSLYRPIPPHYGDDCIIPLDVRLEGYRVLQDPRAIVSDEMPHSTHGELRVRIRMTARNWSGILCRRALLNPWRFPATSWSLISHKFLRWLTPVLLLALLLVNGWLGWRGRMVALLVLQIGFYLAALVGWRRSESQECERIFGYPFAFCLANLGFFLGVLKCIRGQRIIAFK